MAKICIKHANYSDFKFVECDSVPRIGENIAWTYEPAPRVSDVVWFPDSIGEIKADVIVIIK